MTPPAALLHDPGLIARACRRVVTRSVPVSNDVHWCPSRGTTWTCPACGARFARYGEDWSWRTAEELGRP